jgi:hypothetical protein
MVVLTNKEHIVSKLYERVSDEIANTWLYKLLKKINNTFRQNKFCFGTCQFILWKFSCLNRSEEI